MAVIPDGFVGRKTCEEPTCGKELLLLATPNGSTTPVDAKPQKRWVRVKAPPVLPDFPGEPDEEWAYVDTWVSHFVTCTNPARFRRK